MKHPIKLEELEKLSFIRYKQFDGRMIPLLSCYNDKNEWELWLPGPDGLVRILGGEPIEALYFAKTCVEKDDGYLEFFNLVVKHLYFSDIVAFTNGIYDDLHNLAASIQKLELLFELWKEDSEQLSNRYISTELEYIFSTCRSIFDLLQDYGGGISKLPKKT